MNVIAFGKLLREQRVAKQMSLQSLARQLNAADINIQDKHLALWEDLGHQVTIPQATRELVESWRDQNSSPSYEVIEYLINFFKIDPVYFYIIVLNSDSAGKRVQRSTDVVDRHFSQQVLNRYVKLIRLKNRVSLEQVAKKLWDSGVYITSSILERFENGFGPELSGATVCAIGEAINGRSDVVKILNYAAIKTISKSPEGCRRRFARIARMLERDIERLEMSQSTSVSSPNINLH